MTQVRPSIRRTARIVLPILIAIGSWQVWDNIEVRRLDAAFARVRPFVVDDGPPGNRAPAVQESAGRFYAAAAVTVQEGAPYLPDESIPALVARMREALRRAEDPALEDVSRTEAVLAHNDLTLELVDRGASLPFHGFPPGTEFSYRLSGIWKAERVAALQTLDALRKGEASAAARSLTSRLNLLRVNPSAFGSTPLNADALGGQMTDLGLLLAAQDVSDTDLQRLDAGFAAVYGDDDLRHVIAGIAKLRYDFVREVSGARSWQYGHLGVPLRPLLAHRVATTLATASDALEMTGRPWPERLSAMAGLKDRPSIVRNVFLPYPWWQVAEQVQLSAKAIARGVAASRVARVALAADAYRRRSSRLPGSLSDLGLDRESTGDPFTGQSLLYRSGGDGFVVYSVGENGRDDGGAIDVQTNTGAMPGTGKRPDVGMKITYAKPLR